MAKKDTAPATLATAQDTATAETASDVAATEAMATAMVKLAPVGGLAMVQAADGFADFEGDDVAKRGETVTGDYKGPMWLPQLNLDITEDHPRVVAEIKAKLVEAGCEAIDRLTLSGRLIGQFAWGRKLYFIEVMRNGIPTLVKLPEHIALYEGLNKLKWGAVFRVVFDGFGESKPGQNKLVKYRVTAADRRMVLTFNRSDSLYPEAKEAREKRLSLAKARREQGMHHVDGDGVNGSESVIDADDFMSSGAF